MQVQTPEPNEPIRLDEMMHLHLALDEPSELDPVALEMSSGKRVAELELPPNIQDLVLIASGIRNAAELFQALGEQKSNRGRGLAPAAPTGFGQLLVHAEQFEVRFEGIQVTEGRLHEVGEDPLYVELRCLVGNGEIGDVLFFNDHAGFDRIFE